MKRVGGLAIAAAVVANVLWGTTFMASKVVLAQCPPIAATTIRFSIALMAFIIISVILIGQMVAAMVIDHFGLFSMQQSPISWTRTFGVILLLGGAYLTKL